MKASFTIEVTPSDELIPYIDEMKEVSLREFGALPHITVARDESKPDYPLLTKLSKMIISRHGGSSIQNCSISR